MGLLSVADSLNVYALLDGIAVVKNKTLLGSKITATLNVLNK